MHNSYKLFDRCTILLFEKVHATRLSIAMHNSGAARAPSWSLHACAFLNMGPHGPYGAGRPCGEGVPACCCSCSGWTRSVLQCDDTFVRAGAVPWTWWVHRVGILPLDPKDAP